MAHRYNREFKMRVVHEALRPENMGMEHIIAAKYKIKPSTVTKWKLIYLEYGEKAFLRGNNSIGKKTAREMELEKQVSDLQQEVEILKKAAAFLANVKRE